MPDSSQGKRRTTEVMIVFNPFLALELEGQWPTAFPIPPEAQSLCPSIFYHHFGDIVCEVNRFLLHDLGS